MYKKTVLQKFFSGHIFYCGFEEDMHIKPL
jgi:hypothetical protein